MLVQSMKKNKANLLGVFLFLAIILTPSFIASASDIESSINQAGEGFYNFLLNISFWLGTAMVGLGFVVLKFSWLDRQGNAKRVILSVLFGVGGLAASPQIVTFVREMFR